MTLVQILSCRGWQLLCNVWLLQILILDQLIYDNTHTRNTDCIKSKSTQKLMTTYLFKANYNNISSLVVINVILQCKAKFCTKVVRIGAHYILKV